MMDREFEAIKKEINALNNLTLPIYKKPFIVRTDASNIGLGAVLLQEDNSGHRKPIEWTSQKLKPAETRYRISEKEMLAILWGIKKIRI